jgi:hypothetical protein
VVLEASDVGNELYRSFGFERTDTETVDIGGETYRENTHFLQPGAMEG